MAAVPGRSTQSLGCNMTSSTDLRADEDEFLSSYRIFVNALEMLSYPAERQCTSMGNFNVAWELKDDVARGKYLIGRGYLTAEQEAWIGALIAALEPVPTQTLPAGDRPEANLEAMRHASWVPLRTVAVHVLGALQPFTNENAKYLGRVAT
jgi:hypothetical protein